MNQMAWEGRFILPVSTVLDSSLKKNTAFMKRARVGLNSENLPSFKHEIERLSLEKYVTEIVSAVAEGLGKVRTANDITASIEVVSLLHQRFSTRFTPLLTFHLMRALAPVTISYLNTLSTEQRDKEEYGRVAKQKYLLRIVTELWLVGVLRTVHDASDGPGTDAKKKRTEDQSVPIYCLRELLCGDLVSSNLSIATSFVKNFAWLLPPSSTVSRARVITEEESIYLKGILEKYLESLKQYLLLQSRILARESTKIEESLTINGSSSSARESAMIEAQKAHEKQILSAQTLAESLQVDLPAFTIDGETSAGIDGGMIRGFGNSKLEPEPFSAMDLWEDDDQRRFYTVLIDLTQVVPSDMLTEGKTVLHDLGSISAANEEETIEDDSYDDDDNDDTDDTDLDLISIEEEPAQQSTSIGARVEALMSRLPDLTNKELIDKAAIEFAFLNSKASRNRLLKALLTVAVHRTDIVPYYARLIATLHHHMPTIGTTVVNSLHRECRRYVARKALQKDLYARLRNARYLSELVKFGIAPGHVIFHCLRIMVESLTSYDIEVLSQILENCGRHLLRTDSTSARMQSLLDTLKRKSSNLAGIERGLIENAFFYVNPPEYSGLPTRTQSTIEQYVDHLIQVELTKKTYEKTLRQLRKLKWSDLITYDSMVQCFVQVWRFKQSSLHLLAKLLSALAKFQATFAVQVLDHLMEDIISGLEENRFRDNQKRIAAVRFASELYVHKLLDNRLIFRLLYLLLSQGHSKGRPEPSQASEADSPEDYFRIRLVLTVLDGCGQHFTHATISKRLDLFLCFFQYYIKCKSALPIDIDSDIRTILARLRPGLHLCNSLAEAARELDEAITNDNDVPDRNYDRDDASMSSPSIPDGSAIGEEDAVDKNTNSNSSASESSDFDADQDFVFLEKDDARNDLDRAAEAELEREFNQMMADSMEARKPESRKILDIVLPIKRVQNSTSSDILQQQSVSGAPSTDTISTQSPVRFTLLSRKGRSRMLHLPRDSLLAINNAAYKSAELQEKKTIRELTLRYEGAQSREDLEEITNRRTVNARYVLKRASINTSTYMKDRIQHKSLDIDFKWAQDLGKLT